MKVDLASRRFRLPGLGKGAQVIGFLLVIGLLVAMAIQPTRQLLQQKQRVSAMNENLQRVQNVNDRLADRIRRLRDPDYIEQRAREQVGLVRPGEQPYVVLPPGDGGSRKGKAAPKHRTVAPPQEDGALRSFLHFLGLL
ncbi:MAG: septum formation initiator family protein [Actinobacteria bacterium]|nr:septum formation initiator family protein [Actinomycetota bacterium]